MQQSHYERTRTFQEVLKSEEKSLDHYSYLDDDGRIVDIPRCLVFYRAYATQLCREKAREFGHAVALYSVNASGRIYYSRHIDVISQKELRKQQQLEKKAA